MKPLLLLLALLPLQSSPTALQLSEGIVPQEWIEPLTGHRVVRLSQQSGSLSLYFHQNAWSADGTRLLISTPRGLETVDLKTRQLKLIVPRSEYRAGGSSGIEMGRRTPSVYYARRSLTGTTVLRANIDTLDTQELITLPSGASFNGVNADETMIFGTLSEYAARSSRTQRPQRTSMTLFTADLTTGTINRFHQSTAWLNHLQCSPTDPQQGLFCHEGIWQDVDRIWTVRFGEQNATLQHARQMQYEIAGHEFFSHDGQWIWYDLQTPRATEFWLAGVNLQNGQRLRYRLQRDEWSVHYNISRDGTMFAGDGGGPDSVANQTPLPQKRRLDPPQNGQWISLFHPSTELQPDHFGGHPASKGTLNCTRLVDLSKHAYDLEPNVVFSPDGRWIIFRSNMHGARHVYAVSTTPEPGTRNRASNRPAASLDEADPNGTPRRLILIGDSTVRNGSGRGDGGLWGWGQVLQSRFDSTKLVVENRALGGRSSRTYLTEGLWDKSLERVRPGDFIVMQFGHNDGGQMFSGSRPRASIKGNSDETISGVVESTGQPEIVHSYGWYLRKYIADTKARGATPIVLSLVPRDRWENDRVIRSAADYALWAREAAEETDTWFIDLNEIVAQQYELTGEKSVGERFFTADDWTHTTKAGAEVNADCLVMGIRALTGCRLRDALHKPVPK